MTIQTQMFLQKAHWLCTPPACSQPARSRSGGEVEGNVPEWAGPCGPFIARICPQTFAIVSRKKEPVLRSPVFTPLVPKSRLSTGPNASALLRTCLTLCYPHPPHNHHHYILPPPPAPSPPPPPRPTPSLSHTRRVDFLHLVR